MDKKLLRLWLGLSLAVSFYDSRAVYYGSQSQEAILTYESFSLVSWNEDWPDRVVPDSEQFEEVMAVLQFQAMHLLGTFQSKSFVSEFGFHGTLAENFEIDILDVQPSKVEGQKEVSYSFIGRVIFNKNAFEKDRVLRVPIKLPRDPNQIFHLAQRSGKGACSDSEFHDEDNFFYFWDPDQTGCHLRGNREDVLRFRGNLEPLSNTKETYPEYDYLYGDNGNEGDFEIHILLGYIEKVRSNRHPYYNDPSWDTYKDINRFLEENGFELTEERAKYREFKNGRVGRGIGFYRKYSKIGFAQGRRLHIQVKMTLANSEYPYKDFTFPAQLARAYDEADVVMFDGHVGSGIELDPLEFDWIEMDPKKYQIFYLNGCSTHAVYSSRFFDVKGGTQYAEVITTGLPTLSGTGGPNAIALLKHFALLKESSYQMILDDLETSNSWAGTYLMGVNGDEDNVYHPRAGRARVVR